MHPYARRITTGPQPSCLISLKNPFSQQRHIYPIFKPDYLTFLQAAAANFYIFVNNFSRAFQNISYLQFGIHEVRCFPSKKREKS